METSALTFAQPGWFLALILIAGFAVLYYWSQRRSEALINKIVAPRLRDQLAGAVSLGRRAVRATLVLLGMALVVVALARPQKGYIEQEIKQRGRDIIIAIDTSRSMLATDVTPTRLARAKLVAQDLLSLMPGDRVGLIAFAGSAFLQAPLTLDQSAVLTSLDELDTNIIPKGGTDIASAIRVAVDAFGKGEGKTRALVILTDGEELDADGIAAAKKAGEMGIRIYTVGIGSSEGSLIPISDDNGGSDFVRDAAGKPVQSRLDATRLQEIAAAGGGFYTPLSADTARVIFDKGILPLETREAGGMTSRLPIERYEWPLGAALILLAAWMVLGEKRRTPRVPQFAILAALLLAGTLSAQAAPSGNQEYQQGDYDQALADFSRQLKTAPDSEKLQYNAGVAAYKTGNYGAAIDYFTKAILAQDNKLREDASYNLANSLVRRGEAGKSKDEKKSDWKNAIQHYTEALNIDPKNKNAEENRNIVKKLLEDLEKQEKQEQDKKDQDKKDQVKKDDKQKQDQKNQQQQNQNKQDKQDQKDQQQQDQQQQQQGGGQDQKDQQNKDQQKQDQQNKDQNKPQNQQSPSPSPSPADEKQPQNKDQQSQGSQKQPDQQKDAQKQQAAQPTPTPGEKKEGDLKSAGEAEKKDSSKPEQKAAAAQESEAKEGEMTPAQARSLLNSLRSDEEAVKMSPQEPQEQQEPLKNW